VPQAISLQASLTIVPGNGSNTPSFPSGNVSFTPVLNPNPKVVNVDTGPMRPLWNSPNSLAALPGIGSGGVVTKANFLYLSVGQGSFTVQLTTLVPSSSPNVSTFQLGGTLMLEFAAGYELTSVELQGAGQIEYEAAGNQ
jgi:hypothetical protein